MKSTRRSPRNLWNLGPWDLSPLLADAASLGTADQEPAQDAMGWLHSEDSDTRRSGQDDECDFVDLIVPQDVVPRSPTHPSQAPMQWHGNEADSAHRACTPACSEGALERTRPSARGGQCQFRPRTEAYTPDAGGQRNARRPSPARSAATRSAAPARRRDRRLPTPVGLPQEQSHPIEQGHETEALVSHFATRR